MTELTLDTDILEKWIGKEESRTDTVDCKSVNQLQATLDHQNSNYQVGDPLPLAWHWMYFNPTVAARGLGRDGHPAVGGFLPPVALPRRMWAGTRIAAHTPIVIGETLERRSTIKSVVPKSGDSGQLCFVTVTHEISARDSGELRLVDEHDIVYREDDKPGQVRKSPPPAPTDSEAQREIQPDTTMLFRYSAVTFNGHRIHYDLDFCQNVEGYPGLVVHGPLIATWILELARDYLSGSGKAIATFSFRAISPLFHDRPFSVHLKSTEAGLDLWAANADGDLATQCQATLV